jgi:sorbitol-6-phosphate 2-dehydrogenase
MMDLERIAPVLRGLLLSRFPNAGGAVVTLGKETGSQPAPGAYSVRIDPLASEGPDADSRLAALLSASLPATATLPFLLRLESGTETLLFAAAAALDKARALLEGGTAGTKAATSALPTAGAEAQAGSASLRHRVVEGKVALVTGGAQGFGEEIVRGLVASGALVYVADLNAGGAAKLAAELNAAAGHSVAVPVTIDVSSADSVKAAFDTVAATTGGLDLVVSNAGVLKAGAVLEQDLASFDFVTRVNYTGFFLVSQCAARMLRLQHLACPGHRTDIVQINSKSGLAGSNKNGAYAGSKFGGIGLVQSFALELVEHGIKVNAICPGNFFDGPLWSDPEKGLFVQYLRTGKVPGAKTIADVKAFYEAKVPMGRGCEGPDVMRALYYLVEQEYETGQALPVTGGQVMLS